MIRNGEFDKAVKLSKVVGLNEKAAEDVESFAGYISVFNTSNIFYWFIKAEKDADTKPLIVWLQVIKTPFLIDMFIDCTLQSSD